MALTKKRAVWVCAESSYGTDPSANGSSYLPVPALELGDLSDDLELLATNYATGRNFGTQPIAGADGWSFSLTMPLYGLATAAGDGVAGSSKTDDALDLILAHILGPVASTTGEGVASAASATAVTLDTDAIDAQDLLLVHETSVPAVERGQWNLATVDGGSGAYTVAPGNADHGTNPITTAGVSYGTKTYRPTDSGGANCLSWVYVQDDVEYTLTGGRITSASITFEAGQIARFALSVAGDSKSVTTKSSKPAALATPATSPIIGVQSPVWYNGTNYATNSVTFDFGVTAAPVPSTGGVNGRSGYTGISFAPTCSISPLFDTALQDFKRAGGTGGRLLLQLGKAALSGGAINGMAIHVETASVMAAGPSDENGRIRSSMTLEAKDKVEFSAGVSAVVFQVARA